MLETRAVIIQLDGTDALVEAGQGGGCGNCDSVNGCHSGKLAKAFCTKPRRFRVHNSINARLGEEVQVAVADGVLLRSALALYMFPLGTLFVGGFAGSALADSASRDAYAALGALSGLACGFALSRLYAMRQLAPGDILPTITRSADMRNPV